MFWFPWPCTPLHQLWPNFAYKGRPTVHGSRFLAIFQFDQYRLIVYTVATARRETAWPAAIGAPATGDAGQFVSDWHHKRAGRDGQANTNGQHVSNVATSIPFAMAGAPELPQLYSRCWHPSHHQRYRALRTCRSRPFQPTPYECKRQSRIISVLRAYCMYRWKNPLMVFLTCSLRIYSGRAKIRLSFQFRRL